MKTHLLSAQATIEIPFHDVDAMNIVWHGHYLKYFEIARCVLLDTFDYNYAQMQASGHAWPVIESHVRYIQGIKFGQKIRVVAQLQEWEHRLKIAYTIYDAHTNQRLTKGYTTQVAVDMQNGELCLVCPDVLLEKLKNWPNFAQYLLQDA